MIINKILYFVTIKKKKKKDFLKEKYDNMVKTKNFKIASVAGYIRCFIVAGLVIRESNFEKIPEKKKSNLF